MTGARVLAFVLLLALIGAGGIVGMLITTDSIWRWLFLPLAASPLLVGAWSWQTQRRRIRT